MRRVGSCLTTQIYKELKKDQPQQLPGMKAVEAISQERPKRKKKNSFLCETQRGELREALTMKVNMRINECARTHT